MKLQRVTVACVLCALVSATLLHAQDADHQPLAANKYVWISPDEIKALPTTGAAWNAVLEAADRKWPPQISHNTRSDTGTYAQALAYVRTGDVKYRDRARATLRNLPGAEQGVNALSVGRSIVCYVVAADLVGFETPEQEKTFKTWLVRDIRDKVHVGPSGPSLSLVTAQQTKPSNWGAMGGAGRIAIDVYVGDAADLNRASAVFRAYVGERALWSRFNFGDDLSWQVNPRAPVGINPAGAAKDGRNLDGVLPDDLRRGAAFPRVESAGVNYSYEALQALLTQAVILDRHTTIKPFERENKALLRAWSWLADGRFTNGRTKYPPQGDDQWQTFLINKYYGTKYPTKADVSPGKVMAWTAWTHK